MRQWVIRRRQRTRHLIELGGLVIKAGIVELTGDDRAVIFGALLAIADRLRGDKRANALMAWKQNGAAALAADAKGASGDAARQAKMKYGQGHLPKKPLDKSA
jgi:hypothetical protein